MNNEESCSPELVGTKKSISPTLLYGSAGAALFLLGVTITLLIDPYLPASLSNRVKGEVHGRALGFAEAKAKVDNSPLGKGIKAAESETSVRGKVSKVENDKITVITTTEDPFAEASTLNKTITLSASTSVTIIKQTFANQLPPRKGVPQKAVPQFEEIKIKPGDILVGDNVGIFLLKETASLPAPTALTVRVLPRTESLQKAI